MRRELTKDINFIDAGLDLYNFREATDYSINEIELLYGSDTSKWTQPIKDTIDELSNYIQDDVPGNINKMEIGILLEKHGTDIYADGELEKYTKYLKSHLKIMGNENNIFKKNIKLHNKDAEILRNHLNYNRYNIVAIYEILKLKDNTNNNNNEPNHFFKERWSLINNYSYSRLYYISIFRDKIYFNITDVYSDSGPSGFATNNHSYHGQYQGISEHNMKFYNLDAAITFFYEIKDMVRKEFDNLDNGFDSEKETMKDFLNKRLKNNKIMDELTPTIIKKYKRLNILTQIMEDDEII